MILATRNLYEDDDASVSSTFTCEESPKEPASELDTSLRTSARSVQFDESLNTVHENKQRCKDECRETWYSSDDFRCFKLSVAKAVRVVSPSNNRSSSAAIGRSIEQAYDVCCLSSSEQVTAGDVVLSKESLANLSTIYSTKPGRLMGLERIAVRDIARDRVARRGQILQMIRKLQSPNSKYSWKDDNAKAEAVRQLCETLSAPSKLFARSIAVAAQAS
uniref:Uncharacterized protein n=1 Tax=Entomoneis paludosa TaxID=265537 RepID=A0A7S2V9U0_9STRA|eukprot:CAMPEP_0172459210 /NCGR_PEP_ID=MMETSP1065-20121228/31555_1 /TAXON_ID=265537 /ORGANISM="Amphiprora paludosa, Strain CCMP125" /LENGTH=218 /DNA_ID=CAMNT_0013213813 /DNA_START=54 /DNA_END=710 /DNA_ORIENTATION=-